MARAAKDAAEAAAVAEAVKANTIKANGAMSKTGALGDRRRRHRFRAKETGAVKETGAEKVIGDNRSCNGAHSSLHLCRREKVKVHGARGRPRSAARLAVSFPLAGRLKFRSTGAARLR